MELDFERCYRSVNSRDPRFDGWFFTGVTSTGIYCRPSCPAVTPRRANVQFFPSAAAAQREGFRACRRCRPDAAPGSPEWNGRADVVARAMRLIADGVVDRDGVSGLADRLGYTTRHLRRLLHAEVGAGPLGLARAQRAQTARILIETTDMSFSRVAFAAGFTSIRQFNDTIAAVFATTPLQLRRACAGRDGRPDTNRRRQSAGRSPSAGTATSGARITLRLAFRQPCDLTASMAFLAARAVAGVEEVRDGTYRCSLDLPHGAAIVALTPYPDHVSCLLRLTDLRDLQAAVRRCRLLLDLDADPVAVDAHLGRDHLLAPLLRRRPGVRLVASADPVQTAVRVVLGQQVAVASARTLAGRLVAAHGTPLPLADDSLTHLFPTPSALADAEERSLPLTAMRRRALQEMCRRFTCGDVSLDGSMDPQRVSSALMSVPGIGGWSVDLIRLRALGDPDVGLPTDLGVRRGLAHLGGDGASTDAGGHWERWRPWRSYAVTHLWMATASPAAVPVNAAAGGSRMSTQAGVLT